MHDEVASLPVYRGQKSGNRKEQQWRRRLNLTSSTVFLRSGQAEQPQIPKLAEERHVESAGVYGRLSVISAWMDSQRRLLTKRGGMWEKLEIVKHALYMAEC